MLFYSILFDANISLMKTHVGYAYAHLPAGIIERLALMTSTIYSPSRQIKNLSLAWKVKTKERGNRTGRPFLLIFRGYAGPLFDFAVHRELQLHQCWGSVTF
jgi:hypothetical protein